jgi:protoheme IX farnesyltransferase
VTVRDYVEVSKPRIVVVLVIVAVTSMLAASRFDNTPQVGWDISLWNLFFLVISGALASMGSSALNHYFDRDIDRIMLRTAKRPIPSGRLSPERVLYFGLVLCVSSVILALLTLNLVSAGMIALGIFIYVFIYTIWLKRNNPSNIVIGGFAGSAASWAGWISCRTASIFVDSSSLLVPSNQGPRRIRYSERPHAPCLGWQPENSNLHFLQHCGIITLFYFVIFLWIRRTLHNYSIHCRLFDATLPL